MARFESPDEPAEPGPERPGVDHPFSLRPGPRLLADAARLFVGGTDAADDATLLARLGPLVVPALGDIAALYTVDAEGVATLAGAEAAEYGLVQRLRDHLHAEPRAASWAYAGLVTLTRPVIILPNGSDLPAGSKAHDVAPNRVLGLASEIAAPLGSGEEPDAILSLGSLDPARQYEDADLATVEVLAALLASRRTVRALLQREALLRQQVEDGALAGRELAHRLNNDLTMPVGVVELLLDRGGPGSDLQEMLEAASKDLAALEQHIRDFHDQMRGLSGVPAGLRPPAY